MSEPRRLAMAYTGQLRTFSPRWSHANNMRMLVTHPTALFHGFEADVFYVGPHDEWYAGSARRELLALATLKRVLLYRDEFRYESELAYGSRLAGADWGGVRAAPGR